VGASADALPCALAHSILQESDRARTFMLHSMPVSVMMPSLIGAC
jgi:hypothetical protein